MKHEARLMSGCGVGGPAVGVLWGAEQGQHLASRKELR